MQGWAIGVVCVYVALGIFNWVTGLHLLAEFSIPLSILGGLGLAIASNSDPSILPSTTTPQPTDDSVPTADTTEESPVNIPLPPDTTPTKEASISFTINKNVRP